MWSFWEESQNLLKRLRLPLHEYQYSTTRWISYTGVLPYRNFSKDLCNLTPLGQDLEKVATLLGVRKVLNLEDLEFPTLIDESDDRESIVPSWRVNKPVYCAVDAYYHTRHKRYMRITYLDHHFPWCFNCFMNDVLRMLDFSHGAQRRIPDPGNVHQTWPISQALIRANQYVLPLSRQAVRRSWGTTYA